jgi:anthranilate phosphoribosyltransferase
LGGEKHPASDAVALNAAAALVVFDGLSERDAGAQAREILASGKPLKTLSAWASAASKRRVQKA